MLKYVGLCALILALPGLASASLIWDNGVTSINSTIVSQPSADQVVYDDFIITGPTLLTGVTFRGGYAANIARADNFVIRLHTDAGGKPELNDFVIAFDGVPIATNYSTGSGGLMIYQYLATVDLAIDAGTFWLSVFSKNDDSVRGRWVWAHEFTLAAGNEHVLNTLTNYLGPIPYATDFRLTGSQIPAPATLTLLLGGLAGIAMHRMSRARALRLWPATLESGCEACQPCYPRCFVPSSRVWGQVLQSRICVIARPDPTAPLSVAPTGRRAESRLAQRRWRAVAR